MERARKTSVSHHELLGAEPGMKISSDRALGLVFGAFFAVAALLPLLRGGPVRRWCFAVSLLCFVVALVVPRVLHPLNVVWARFAILLHRIVSPVAMALLFYLGFALMGFVVRLLGKDLLRLKATPGRESYWIPRDPPGPAPDSMLRQF